MHGTLLGEATAQQSAEKSQASVAKVENGGLLFTDNPAGVSGTDAGYSVPMGKQTLWIFGDVFLLDPTAPAKSYVGGVSNCALLLPSGSGTPPLRKYSFLTDTTTGLARQVIPLEGKEDTGTRLWPGGGWYDAAQRKLFLYFSRITATGGGGPFDFRIEGHGLLQADASDPATLKFERIRLNNDNDLWWKFDAGPLFGAAVVTGGPKPEPYLYIVGIEERKGKKYGKMARVRKTQITDLAAYEYFAGGADTPRWSKNIGEAADVEGLADFPNELSVAYNPYLGGYLAVHSVYVEDRIRLSLAPTPWGPYRPLGEIGAPRQAFTKAFCYAGKEHPELAEQNGRVLYITYVDNQRYWLQLLKVTLQK